ncbi:MAG: ABC transporter ATP-binding protein, partial [Acidimicrobiia bacterium]|nr:ABC transporter ATP-binding protein [Acidimicrobiia bacterium]
MTERKPLLEVDDLRTYFSTEEGIVKAVDGLSFTIHESERFGVVGESGSGKSVTAMSIMRLIEPPAGEIVTGEIRFRGNDLLALDEDEMRKIRGGEIAMIFQDPMTALNPVYTIGNQLVETITLHQNVGKSEAFEIGVQALDDVHIPNPRERMEDYPHQLSGGMRQRVMIAMAL